MTGAAGVRTRTALVTGGNTGIGKAIVLAVAAEGANVVVDYIMHPEYTAEVIAAAGRAGGCAVGVEADVSRTPLADDDIMILHEGTRAALVSGPDGHRFLVEEAVRGKGLYPAIKNLAEFLDASSQPDEGAR